VDLLLSDYGDIDDAGLGLMDLKNISKFFFLIVGVNFVTDKKRHV
jgi:hypothetical protein